MKKRLLSSIAFAALLSVGLYAFAAPAPTAHAAPTASHTILRESGLSASASYTGEYETASGTVMWNVDYAVSIGSMQTSSGKTIIGPMVWAHVGEFQTPEQSFQAFGEAPVPASDVQIDKNLNTAALLASVDVTVIVQDGEALPWGTEITLHVEPTQWTGVGPFTIGSITYHERTPAYKLTIHMNGRSRSATATGDFSYTAPWNNVAVSASDATNVSGQLSDSRSTTITIQYA